MTKKQDEDKKEVPVESFAHQVWQTLSRIDVSTHVAFLEKTAKRPAIDYLPWHKAWMLCKREFPASTFAYEDDVRHPDGTVEVGVRIDIMSGENDSQETYARLAVMDNWMNPIANPTARQVNDSRQRVLVKALAFAGLGLNLWGHDSIPVGELADPIDADQIELIESLIEKSGTDRKMFLKWCDCDSVMEMQTERFASAKGLLEAKIKRMQQEKKK
jgi:hypothetical protein